MATLSKNYPWTLVVEGVNGCGGYAVYLAMAVPIIMPAYRKEVGIQRQLPQSHVGVLLSDTVWRMGKPT